MSNNSLRTFIFDKVTLLASEAEHDIVPIEKKILIEQWRMNLTGVNQQTAATSMSQWH